MSRSSARRGQVEPLAALAALLAVAAGLALYAGVVLDATPAGGRNLAEPTLERVRAAVSDLGVVRPARLPAGPAAGPAGYAVHVAVVGDRLAWHAGPPAPDGADAAAEPASVRVRPGVVRPATLRVEVWAA